APQDPADGRDADTLQPVQDRLWHHAWRDAERVVTRARTVRAALHRSLPPREQRDEISCRRCRASGAQPASHWVKRSLIRAAFSASHTVSDLMARRAFSV